ncbi:hypothetical protein [Neisseria canis]|uniref:Phage associated protein n=1 Tax=Neisseria canis TaxID=493 RepID=A0A448D9Z5_9NEIS|nr:hypothetical protein [Neisseria canis]OSI12970.1 hypothetical protein BWD07_02550 [Neisseria canis]VEF02422.1 Uncharacterised protein [Neisseria canis]
MLYSSNKDYDQYIKKLVASGNWFYIPKGRRKHAALRHINGGICAIPCSPGSRFVGLHNFRRQIRNTERKFS